MRSPITTHVLDTAHGHPAAGVPVTLEISQDGRWQQLAKGMTDEDGRISDLLATDHTLTTGIYRITFDTAAYFQAHGTTGFYPYVSIAFEIRTSTQHYHVPLLLNPYGYSTYRGS